MTKRVWAGLSAMLLALPAAAQEEARDAQDALIVESAEQQNVAPPQRGGPPRGPWFFELEGGALYQPKTGLDGGGQFSVSRWTARFGVNYGWDRRTSVGIGIGTGASNYEFFGDATLGGAQPWNRIEDYRVSAPIRFGFGETGNAIIIPSLRYNGEAGAR